MRSRLHRDLEGWLSAWRRAIMGGSLIRSISSICRCSQYSAHPVEASFQMLRIL